MKKYETKEAQLELLEELNAGHGTVRYFTMPERYHQTVRDHVAEMQKIVTIILERYGVESLDLEHLKMLILAHDLPELSMEQDITSMDAESDDAIKIQKIKDEERMTQELAGKYGSWLSDLIYEYEFSESIAAIFIKWVDKYESSLHFHKIFAGEKFVTPKTKSWLVHNARKLAKYAETPFLAFLTLMRLSEIEGEFAKHGCMDEFLEIEKVMLAHSGR